jgi:hypothetical protein
VNGTAYQSSNSFDSRLILLYVRNLTDPSCVTISGSTTSINSTPPVVPTTASVTQPTCAVQSGISVTTQSGVEYSLDGTTYQASNTFSGLTRMIILYVQSTSDNTCVTIVIGDNNKCCATSSCSSNSIEHDTAYLWCTIRNDCSFDSNRSGVVRRYDISVLEYVLRAGSK